MAHYNLNDLEAIALFIIENKINKTVTKEDLNQIEVNFFKHPHLDYSDKFLVKISNNNKTLEIDDPTIYRREPKVLFDFLISKTNNESPSEIFLLIEELNNSIDTGIKKVIETLAESLQINSKDKIRQEQILKNLNKFVENNKLSKENFVLFNETIKDVENSQRKEKLKEIALSPFVVTGAIALAAYKVVVDTSKIIGSYINEIKEKSIDKKYEEYVTTKEKDNKELDSDKNLTTKREEVKEEDIKPHSYDKFKGGGRPLN